ncbi:trypsin-like serine protease [Dokdonella sp.]|uniref:S1 family peptidase n=1 Tax=Dokdonella sp. TaxID=2291710 RepID=UPI001B0A57AC|nr:trypsin-like serine protease [Dokdonella sp.]MBO9662695.1 trypsin-like serine protease [Dokdonella sp.]
MRGGRLALLLLLTAASGAGAIVIRDDVDDAAYRVPASELPALADLPGEGHGVLIAPQWIVTAAHAVGGHEPEKITVAGTARKVERVVVHPGYKQLPQTLVDQAIRDGDATGVIDFLAASDDVALIELAAPATDVAPVPLYKGGDELGRTVELVGKGATGTGARGHDPQAPHRTELRRAFNRITRADERWICYLFDKPPAALPLEGMLGNGDSGGPVLIEVDGRRQLAGLASWKILQGNPVTVRPGAYGQSGCNVRLSRYAGWIEATIAAGQPRRR